MMRGFVLILISSLAWSAPMEGDALNSPDTEDHEDLILSARDIAKGRGRGDEALRPDMIRGRSGWTANDGTGRGVDIFDGLLTNDVGLSVSNIEDVTGAVLVKSRLIDKTGSKKKSPGKRRAGEEGVDRSALAKSMGGEEPVKQPRLEMQHRMAEEEDGQQVYSPGGPTRLLVTFVEPVQARTAASGAGPDDVTRVPTVLSIMAGEGDIAFEYVAAEQAQQQQQQHSSTATPSDSKLRTSSQQKTTSSEKDSITPEMKNDFAKSPTKDQDNSYKKTKKGQANELEALIKTSATVNLEQNDDIINRSGKAEKQDNDSEQVDSKLISVRDRPPPSDDPEVIHLTQRVNDRLSTTTLPSVLFKTITATVTETFTHIDTKIPSFIKTTISTLTKTSTAVTTSTAVSTTVKIETSTVLLTPTPSVDPVVPAMMMNRPTRNTFLSPMPSSSSLDTREALFSTSQTPKTVAITPTQTIVRQETSTSSIISETTTELTTLDPTYPDFFLPAVLRDAPTGTDDISALADANNTAIIHRITAILKDTQNISNEANRTENMIKVISMLKNMTQKGTLGRNLTETIKTPAEATSALQDLLNEILKTWKPNNTREEDEVPSLLDNRNAPGEGEQNITHLLNNSNTHLGVWPTTAPTEEVESLLDNRNAPGPTDQNITQLLNHTNTQLAVWPTNGPVTRIDGNQSQLEEPGNFTPTDDDPFRCRREGIEYPLGIEYRELRARMDTGALLLIDVRDTAALEETGRLPWSYNLPLAELQKAFKMSSSAFQAKYGFPKPSVSSPHVVLTSRAGHKVVTAWNILQQFGYCNVRLYYGSFLEWHALGGSLIPYFAKVDESTAKQQSTAAAQAPNTDFADQSAVFTGNDTLPITVAPETNPTAETSLLLSNKADSTLIESLPGSSPDSESLVDRSSGAESGASTGGSSLPDPTGAVDGRRTNAHQAARLTSGSVYQTASESSNVRRTNGHQQPNKPSAVDDDNRKLFQAAPGTEELPGQLQGTIIIEEPAEHMIPDDEYDYLLYSDQ